MPHNVQALQTAIPVSDHDALLRLFVDHVEDYAMFLLDPEGHIISWNTRAEKIFGYSAAEVMGNHVGMFRTPEDRLKGKSQHVLDIAAEAGSYEEIHCRAHKTGRTFTAQVVVTALRDEGKALQGYGMLVRDITDQQTLDFLKMDTEKKLRSLVTTVLDTIVDGVITINHDGLIQSYNDACFRLFGYTRDEVYGKNISMLMPEPYRAEHDGYLHNYARTKEAKIIGIGREVTGRRKDGSLFPMELAVGATTQGGNHAFVGIIRDITERREAENQRDQLRQSQKMEAIGQLTGGIAHDFNNLLAIITGNLDFIAERLPASDPIQSYITPAINASLNGAALTKQLLAFSRMQALQPNVMSTNELIENFSHLVARTLGDRIALVMNLAPDTGNIYVDRSQMETALLNLSVNACHAMPKGGKLVYETKNVTLDSSYASLIADITAGDYVLISVSDTGTGMPPEVVAKAFDPFFTTKGVGMGSGLGLSMVYGFVKQSAGHIKIYSEVGYGTSIHIYLKRVHDNVSQAITKAPDIAINTDKKFRTILIVEDNKEVLAVTASMVESLGYTILTAENANDALAILQSRSDIHLLLTDVMLPGALNGPALAKKALEIHPDLKVLFNSGYAEQAIIENGLLEEGVNLLSKPFRKPQMAEKLSSLLGNSPESAET